MAGIKTNVTERYSNGQVIISEGVVSAKAYVILSGKVRISKRSGDRAITIAILKEGDTFGEMGLFQEAVRSATASAVGETAVGVINKDDFNKMVEDCPETLRYIINLLINKLRLTTNSLASIGMQLEKAKKALDAVSNKDAKING
ncbi:MAG: cyclic nucleotide-binding domain-containing protein [Nitrospinae bacterium]|nr:cyclic nucleotide-binding domain-containing protein [Nitrospinota bacterium]